MKRTYITLLAFFLTVSMLAQSPQKMSYQAVIRDAGNVLVTNHAIGMKISILQGSATGTPVYVETQNPTTNANGLVTIEIGGGTPVTGTLAGIDWSAGPYYIKTETDPSGGNTYTILGTSQLISVPYALYSQTSEISTDAVKLTGNQTIAGNKSFSGTTTVIAPVNPSDAVNKAYVDASTKYTVSKTGDTLYLGNKYVIIPNLSISNPYGIGTIPTIPDIIWSQVTVGASANFTGWIYVAFGNNTFIAVTDNNCASLNNSAYVSSDFGLNWTQKATPGSTDMSGIAFSPVNNYFCVAFRCWEQTRNYAYSTDNGDTWTPMTHTPSSYADYRYDLYWLKDYFFSSINNHTCDRSPDGVNWTNLTFAGSNTTSVTTYSEKYGLYYASDGTNFWTSPDASSWIQRDTLGQYKFIAGNNVVLAYRVYTHTPIIKQSIDGFTFQKLNTLPNVNYIYKVKYLNGLFWAVISVTGDDSKKVMVSFDGTSWKILNTPSLVGNANDIEIGYDSNLKEKIIIIPCDGGIFLRGVYNSN